MYLGRMCASYDTNVQQTVRKIKCDVIVCSIAILNEITFAKYLSSLTLLIRAHMPGIWRQLVDAFHKHGIPLGASIQDVSQATE